MTNQKNTKEADAILARILSELRKKNKKQAELIRYLGLPAGTFTNWKLKRSRNFCEHLYSIALFLEVDPGWLLTGETKDGLFKDSAEKKLIEEFRKLNEDKQTAVIQNVIWLTK